jgi:drug/metabolite transporter (DMT)-like permease
MIYMLLLMIVVAASFGQVFLKLAVQTIASGATVFSAATSLLTDWRFLVGVGLYALTSVAWLVALQSLPLSRAYPALALTFVLVPMLAKLLLGEQVALVDVLGMLLIVIGVSIVGARR